MTCGRPERRQHLVFYKSEVDGALRVYSPIYTYEGAQSEIVLELDGSSEALPTLSLLLNGDVCAG